MEPPSPPAAAGHPGRARPRWRRWCRLAALLFALAYAAALGLLAIGTFGLLGSERDPLAAVFLLPLGLPWNLLPGALGNAGAPWQAIAAPAVNLAGLWLVCRWRGRRRGLGGG